MPNWLDEKVDVTNSIRKAYNEIVLDVVEGDKGYIDMFDWKNNWKNPTKFQEFSKEIWNKMKGNAWAKKYALEDYLHWLN